MGQNKLKPYSKGEIILCLYHIPIVCSSMYWTVLKGTGESEAEFLHIC